MLGLRDAVVGISAPTMVVIVGLALEIAPIRVNLIAAMFGRTGFP